MRTTTRAAFVILAAATALLLCLPCPSSAARLKDVAAIGGIRNNPVVGYGLVVGLNGTGDTDTTTFAMQSVMSMLQKLGVSVPLGKIKVKNVAAVMITAEMPTQAKKGWRMDVIISSLGDSTSLEGGTLVMTPLLAPNGDIYAVAQGPLIVGGFSAGGASGGAVTKNHPTAARIPGGAIVEKEIAFVVDGDTVQVLLASPDFATSSRAAASLNARFGEGTARAWDGAEIRVRVPDAYRTTYVDFLAKIGECEVEPDQIARVVVNEKTGTVVIGQNVRIQTVALAHGALNIVIRETSNVSQPAPLSSGGKTVVTPQTEVRAKEEKVQLSVVEPTGATIGDLVTALNRLGVTPRDLIAIMQALRQAGALQAEIALM